MRSLTLQALSILGLLVFPASAHGQTLRSLLGRWRGTSICVKATWNQACNDEVVQYDFVPVGTDSSKTLLHAAKIVGGVAEPMGDLTLSFNSTTASWDGDFANARVHIRWTYQARGDTLTGQLVLLPAQQVARHVRATRERTAGDKAPP